MSEAQDKPAEKVEVEEVKEETAPVYRSTLGYPGNVSRVYYGDYGRRSYANYPGQYASYAPGSRVVYDSGRRYVDNGVEVVDDRPVRVSYSRLEAPVEGVTRSYVTSGSNYYFNSTYPSQEVVVDGETRPVRVSYRRLDAPRTDEVVYSDVPYTRPARVSYRRYADNNVVSSRSYVTNTRSYLNNPVERVYTDNVQQEVTNDVVDNVDQLATNRSKKPQEVMVESKKKDKRHNVPAPTDKGKKQQGFCSRYCGC